MKKIVSLMLILTLFITILIPNLSLADVGDFESYDSSWDSDWGASDWESDWDSGFESNYVGGYSSINGGGEIVYIIIFIIIFVIASKTKNRSGNSMANNYSRPANASRGYIKNEARSEMVANNIREIDKYFNDEKFITWVKNLFIKLQTAWSERDWETIRPLESEALFEQHSRQLQGYVDRKQINKMERICVNFAELVSFSKDNEKEILVVALNSSMTDYIIDETTGNLVNGDKSRRITNTYKLTFVRKNGVETKEGTDDLNTTNCPNCGAPTEITSSGKCEYCGSVITIGEHGWVLNDMERY